MLPRVSDPGRDLRDCRFCGMGQAVRAFAAAEYKTVAGRVVWQMRRVAAAGAFCDGFHYRTQWDEYCRYVQDRPDGISAIAWQVTVSTFTGWLIGNVPDHVAPLMTLAVAWDELDDEGQEGLTEVFIDRGLMERHLSMLVEDLARRQDLSRLQRRRDDT
jgi:hypothetical protein